MATETISWNALVGGTSAPLPTTTTDTGAVLAGFTTNVGSAGNVIVNTTASDPDNNTTNPDNSQLSMVATAASPTAFTVNFSDDTSDAVTSGAYDATFGINDIDAGSLSGGFRDKVTISAFDTNGNPLPITVSSNSNYTVTTNSDGSVTLLANSNTNSWNSPSSYAQVTVSGGPIASMSVNLENVGIGSNNIMLTEISYNTNPLPPICFMVGTLIETDKGPVVVEDLMVSDMVRTRDNGFQPVRWIGARTLAKATLATAPELRPVRISAGALGSGVPSRDLFVSPQHRILVRSNIAQKMFGAREVLVAAKQLVILEGVDFCDMPDGVGYVHFLCDQHEVVFANGCETESLFTGAEALKSVGPAAREEIFAIFPELREMDHEVLSARTLASGRLGRKLAHRHAQNGKPLVQ